MLNWDEYRTRWSRARRDETDSRREGTGPDSNGHLSGEHGHLPGGQGRLPGGQGRLSGENGRLSGEHGPRWGAYRTTVGYAGLLAAGCVGLATRDDAERGRWLLWASTNLDNLQHHPVPALVLSAFLPESHDVLWVALAVVGLGGAEQVLGSARTALLAAAGHLGGTAVSEGILAFRVHAGSLPEQSRHIVDVGPSFVVVSCLLATVTAGRPRIRIVAGLSALALTPFLLQGLFDLDVAAVGHVCAGLIGAAGGWALHRGPVGQRLARGPAVSNDEVSGTAVSGRAVGRRMISRWRR